MLSKSARRFWEILPGATTLSILLLPVVLSFIWPVGLAYFIIVFDTYWLIKALVMGGHLTAGYLHVRRAMQTDWLARLHQSENLDSLSTDLMRQFHLARGFEATRLREEWEQAERIRHLPAVRKPWQSIIHAVVYAIYKESFEVVEASVRACLESNYPKNKIVIVLALEERAGVSALAVAERIKARFAGVFKDILVSVHPDGIVGELKAKGANVYHAGKELQKYIDNQQTAYDNVIVSCFDADTLPSRQYLANVTYQYIMTPERTFRSYQPIPLFNNNIWDVPMINRLVAFGSSFWQMIESTRPYRLINFSSQAMSLKTLVDIDFWDRTVVSEDSKQFYRAYYQYNGNHRAIPIFTPVSMDAVLGKTYWETLKAQYIQKRRWAWGIEHFPYAVEKFFTTRGRLSWWDRIIHPIRIFEGHVSWATSSLLIALGGWMPILLNIDFRSNILAYHLPVLASNLLSLTWVGIVISTIISFQLLPPRPHKYGVFKAAEMLLQWVLVPISGIIFGSIPAIDAELRLMLGKYLGFHVTEKERKTQFAPGMVDKTMVSRVLTAK
ncbi:MAG: glycosyltransferase [bacterium]